MYLSCTHHMPQNMLKIFLFVLLPMEVSAFPSTMSQIFHFKNVPLEIGARHIHTPEHLESAFGVTLPQFKVFLAIFRPYTEN